MRGSLTGAVLAVIPLAMTVVAPASDVGAAASRGPARDQPTSHLVFTANRDGDNDVFAVDVRGGRVAALTRNNADERSTVAVNRRGDWVALVRESTVVLLAGDGRRERRVGEGGSPVFSPNGRLLAFAHEHFATETQRLRLVRVPDGKVRAVGGGAPIAFSPNGRVLAYGVDAGLGLLDVVTGRRRLIRGTARSEFAGWSPDSRRVAFIDTREEDDDTTRSILRTADIRRPATSSTVLEGRYLQATWLTASRLAYERTLSDADSTTEIGFVAATGRTSTAIARGDVGAATWSPLGDRVVYTRRISLRKSVLEIVAIADRRPRVVATASNPQASWSPTGRRLAVRTGASNDRYSILSVARSDGRRPRQVLRGRWLYVHGWSPDDRHLAVSASRGLALVDVETRTVRRVPDWHPDGASWSRGPLSPRAPTAAALPPSELAHGRQLRSHGRILELASDGKRVAVLVESWRSACEHVSGWIAGGSRIVPRGPHSPCGGDSPNVAFGLGLRGTWAFYRSFSCGNTCYVLKCAENLWGRRGYCRDDYTEDAVDFSYSRPAPRRETRRGVSILTRGGVIRLSRRSDGRRRIIRPPGGAVDAELENAGLFYAFNARGRLRGHVTFVPFAELFGPRSS